MQTIPSVCADNVQIVQLTTNLLIRLAKLTFAHDTAIGELGTLQTSEAVKHLLKDGAPHRMNRSVRALMTQVEFSFLFTLIAFAIVAWTNGATWLIIHD